MSTIAGGDVDAFVAARWPDLETVALVATLDRAAARALTEASFADVLGRWEDVAGAPTAATRAALRERVLRLPFSRDPADPGAPATPVDPGLGDAVVDPSSAVPGSLLDALALETPTARLDLANRLLGDDVGSTTVDDGATGRLLAAHRRGRALDGLAPADDRLESDLLDVVERLRVGLPEPPDPTALVTARLRAERDSRVRRRTVVAGGAAVVLGGLGWAVARERPTPGPRTGVTGPNGAAVVDDGRWTTTTRWPPRGILASDTGIAARIVTGGSPARVLYADDVHDVRVVVAARLDAPPTSTRLRVLTGSVGAPAEQLVEIPYPVDVVSGRPDVVAFGVPHPTGAIVLALAPPRLRVVELSSAVRPTSEGRLERTWRPLDLVGGIGTLFVGRPWGPAARVRLGGFDAPLPIPQAWSDPDVDSPDPLRAAIARTAEATIYPPYTLRGEVVVEERVAGRDLDPDDRVLRDVTATLTVCLVRAPGRAVVRVVDLRGADLPWAWRFASAAAVPRDAVDTPVVVRLDGRSRRVGRFLVVVPGGGATVQLLGTSPSGYPLSEVQRLDGRVTVVPVVNADFTGIYRLVVQDASGRTLYDGVPREAQRTLPDAAAAQREVENLVQPFEPEEPAASPSASAAAAGGTGWLGLPLPYDG